jgi:hypothetical protein
MSTINSNRSAFLKKQHNVAVKRSIYTSVIWFAYAYDFVFVCALVVVVVVVRFELLVEDTCACAIGKA